MSYKLLENWNHFLDLFCSDRKDVYFSEEYLKLYETRNIDAVCYLYKENTSFFLIPFLKRRFEYKNKIYYDFESAYGYGGPICNTDDEQFKTRGLKAFYSYCYENNYVAGLIRFHPLLNNHREFSAIGETIFDRHTIAIDLTYSEDDIWLKEIHTKNRNTIKKGINSGLEFIIDNEFHHLDDFISLYNNTMMKLDADSFYYFSPEYYISLKNNIHNSFLGLVKFEDRIISGAIFLYSKEFGHYHLAGSDQHYLRLNPNNFLIYNVYKYLKSLGITKFHLGGGTNSDELNSLYQFKRKFSQNTYDFYIGKLIFNPSIYSQLCTEWSISNSEKEKTYRNYLLKYKY